jgi:hypothetical protein
MFSLFSFAARAAYSAKKATTLHHQWVAEQKHVKQAEAKVAPAQKCLPATNAAQDKATAALKKTKKAYVTRPSRLSFT